MIEGLDVSSYQGAIDWEQVAASKRFVIVRGGDGRYQDPNIEVNVQGALSVGMRVEVYHFLRFNRTPAVMAGECQRTWERGPGAKRLWLDLEDSDYAHLLPDGEARLTWFEDLKARLQMPYDTYTGKWFVDGYMGGNLPLHGHEWGWLGQYPLNNSLRLDPIALGFAPVLPGGWPRYGIWQYTSEGSVLGIDGNVDLDVADPAFLQEDDMALEELTKRVEALERASREPRLVKTPTHDAVYAVVGGTLQHLRDWQTFAGALGYSTDDISTLPAEHPIFGLPTTYPSGVPAELRS